MEFCEALCVVFAFYFLKKSINKDKTKILKDLVRSLHFCNLQITKRGNNYQRKMKHSIDTSGSFTATFSSSSFFVTSTATFSSSFFAFTVTFASSAPSFSGAGSRFFTGLLLEELGARVAGERERRLGPSCNPVLGRGPESAFRRLWVGFCGRG